MKKIILTMLIMLFAAMMISGCTKKDSNGGESSQSTIKDDVSVKDILQEVKDAYGENYLPNMEMDAAALQEQVGLSPDLYEEAVGEMPMINVQVDTFIAVKAKEGNAEKVMEQLSAYQGKLQADSAQYPMNLPKIMGSEVFQCGNYVFFIMLGSVSEDILGEGGDEAVAACKEQNQIAVHAIESILIGE